MPDPTPDADVAAVIIAANPSSVGWTLGTNIFTGPVRPATEGLDTSDSVPVQSIFCLSTGGPPPQAYLSNGGSYWLSRVQVRVRSAKDDFAGGQAIARAARKALQAQVPTGYVSMLVQESEPNYLAEDAQGAHEWSFNVEATWTG